MASQSQAQSQLTPSSVGTSGMHEEFTVRMPRDKRKTFTMMKFGTSSSVDFSKMGEQPVKIERENNLKEYKSANDIDLLPKFGAGSEYGRELKEESRRKKYGIMLKRYDPENQPWILKLGAGKQGKRYKGVREGTVAENTSYYIFTKAADGAFEAFPVGEWYNFTPIVKYKYLNSEEAEEEFVRRDKTLNFFNIMLKKRLRKEDDKDLDDDEEEGGKKKKGKKKRAKNMILTDMEEWNDLQMSDDDDVDDDNEDNDMNGAAKKKKKPKGKGKQKATKNSKMNSDDEAIEESDEGDYDDREVDYISDSGSSDSLSGPEVDDKDKNQEKGVDEEKGLRNILDSDAEDDEEEEEKVEAEEEVDEKEEKKEEKVKKGDDSSSSSSDDDSDIEKNMSSAIFMQNKKDKNGKAEKKEKENATATESESTAGGEPSVNPGDKKEKDKGVKRKGEKSADGKSMPSKKHRSDDIDGISEDAIRRYLTRKPMTTKDLLQKFRSKKLNMSNEKITHTIAQLLKKINPERTTVNKKLYLSLKKLE